MALPAKKAVLAPPSEEIGTYPQIMLADDSHTTREVIKQVLGDEFDVMEFDNGLSAWERIEGGNEAKALITDIDMPGIDGVELISRIRKSTDPKIRDLPIIAITGAEDQETRRRAFVSGATGFIIKPIDSIQLQALLHAYVHHDKVKRELKEKSVELEQQSVTEASTELRSRRYFMDRGQQDVAFCQRRDKDLALIRVDVNHYGDLWSNHSKERMDGLLKWLGKLLLSSARVEDTVACLGGPEFAILAMATDMAGALVVCDRLRDTVAARPFNDGNITIPISFSIGIATLGADRAQSMDELLTLAQERLSQPYPPVVAEPHKTPAEDPMEELSVEELEQLIRQEVVGEELKPGTDGSPDAVNIEAALRLLAQGKNDALLPHIEQLAKQLQPLLDFLQTQNTKQ